MIRLAAQSFSLTLTQTRRSPYNRNCRTQRVRKISGYWGFHPKYVGLLVVSDDIAEYQSINAVSDDELRTGLVLSQACRMSIDNTTNAFKPVG